jgi:hypothetical protein
MAIHCRICCRAVEDGRRWRPNTFSAEPEAAAEADGANAKAEEEEEKDEEEVAAEELDMAEEAVVEG